MIAPLAKFIDWSTLQTLSLPFEIQLRLSRRPSPNGQAVRLDQALPFLNGPDFIPAESQPARIEFEDPLHFRFPTPRPGDIAKNNVVYGRLYRCGERWRERPAVILLHGGGDFPNHRIRFPMIGHDCNRMGINAATLVLPHHFQRHDSKALKSLDYRLAGLRFAKTIAQAVAEIRALTGWLLSEGCPAIALAGASYGGYLAGLAACHDARVAAAVLIVPGVCINQHRLLTERIIWRRTRQLALGLRAVYEAMDKTPLNLIASQPVVPRENILIIKGEHDLLVASGPVEELWQAWRRPDIWRLPYGHISMFGARGVSGRVLRWLVPRFNDAIVGTPKGRIL